MDDLDIDTAAEQDDILRLPDDVVVVSASTHRHLREVEQRHEQLLNLQEQLYQLHVSIRHGSDLRDVLESVLRAASRVIRFSRGSVLLLEHGMLRMAASDPPASPDVHAQRLPADAGLPGRVVRGEAVMSADVAEDARGLPPWRQMGSNRTGRSYVGVPLVSNAEVIGVLQIDAARVDAFTWDDLTVLKGIAAHIAQLVERTRRSDEGTRLEMLKSDFVARVGHELRTPITVLSGFTDTLLEHDSTLDPERRRLFLERLATAIDRLQHVADGVLSLTALEAGLSAPTIEESSITQAIRDEIEQVGAQGFIVEAAPNLTAHTDVLLLRRALRALLDNARVHAAGAIVRAWGAADGSIIIDVVDDGPGVSPVIAPRLFERFVRGDHSEPGLGLGLPMARHLVGLVGGRLDHLPREHGSTFRIRLPGSA